jgi:hypothetical protein
MAKHNNLAGLARLSKLNNINSQFLFFRLNVGMAFENESTDKTCVSNKIFDLIKESEEAALAYVNAGKLDKIDCMDENKMTPLQHAAYRGLKKLCSKLIENGANVNCNEQDQGYTALMFAAIANHTDVVRLLLEHDANIEILNKIGRSATQMAAFVNATESVDIINNYISKSDIQYYAKINSINETKPQLPAICVNDLHALLIGTNYSPVFIVKQIHSRYKTLMAHMDEVLKTLELFIQKSFKKQNMECPNDVLAFKLHYYRFILEYVKTSFQKFNKTAQFANEETDESQFYRKFFESVAKQFMTEVICSDTQSPYRVFEERFLRESMRKFPYIECALLRQMVQIISKVKIGNEPSALYVITSCLVGQKMRPSVDEEDSIKIHTCTSCTQKGAMLCSKCKKTAYCDQYCQRIHWTIHKKDCLSS